MKAVRNPQKFISAHALTGSFVSASQDVLEVDVTTIQLNYTGSPVGSFSVLCSLDNVNFAPLYFSVNGTGGTSVAVPSNTSPIFIDLYGGGFKYLQISYAFTSGSGSVDGYISGKRLGD